MRTGTRSRVSTAGDVPLRLRGPGTRARLLQDSGLQGLVPVIPGDLFHSPLFQPVQSLVKLLVFGAEAAWLCDRDLTSVEAFEFSPRQCSLSAGTVQFRGVWGGSPRGSGCQEMQSWLVTLGNGELWFS